MEGRPLPQGQGAEEDRLRKQVMDTKTLEKIAKQAAAEIGLNPNLVGAHARRNTEDSERGTMLVQFWLPKEKYIDIEVRVDVSDESIKEAIKTQLKEKLGL